MVARVVAAVSLIALVPAAMGFSAASRWASSTTTRATVRRQLTEDADFPSDSGEFDFAPAVEDAVVIQPPEEVKLELLRLAASTAKREAASDAEKDQGRGLVA